MRDILIYGALAIFVLAFILVKLSDRKEVSKDKPFFGGLVDGQKASKKAFLLVVLPILVAIWEGVKILRQQR